jgi:GT2 family glycosyltransferase
MSFPKISIVTPSYNHAQYLEQTITSVLNQGYPNLEYIIIDGGSTDGSIEIIKKYSKNLSFWVSEKDDGMYHAIQKGFEKATGEVMGWINSDDMHHTRSLFTLAQIFGDYPDINWIQGFTNHIDEQGRIVFATSVDEVDKLFFYQKKHRDAGKFIQQESTFWRSSLWDKSGGYISTKYGYAGDFELWIRFFQFEKLYNLNALLGSFRHSSSGQASIENHSRYLNDTYKVLENYPLSTKERLQLRFRNLNDYFGSRRKQVQNKIRQWLGMDHHTVVNGALFFENKSQQYKKTRGK